MPIRKKVAAILPSISADNRKEPVTDFGRILSRALRYLLVLISEIGADRNLCLLRKILTQFLYRKFGIGDDEDGMTCRDIPCRKLHGIAVIFAVCVHNRRIRPHGMEIGRASCRERV